MVLHLSNCYCCILISFLPLYSYNIIKRQDFTRNLKERISVSASGGYWRGCVTREMLFRSISKLRHQGALFFYHCSHVLLTLVCSSNFFIYYFKHGNICQRRKKARQEQQRRRQVRALKGAIINYVRFYCECYSPWSSLGRDWQGRIHSTSHSSLSADIICK